MCHSSLHLEHILSFFLIFSFFFFGIYKLNSAKKICYINGWFPGKKFGSKHCTLNLEVWDFGKAVPNINMISSFRKRFWCEFQNVFLRGRPSSSLFHPLCAMYQYHSMMLPPPCLTVHCLKHSNVFFFGFFCHCAQKAETLSHLTMKLHQAFHSSFHLKVTDDYRSNVYCKTNSTFFMLVNLQLQSVIITNYKLSD